MTLNNLETKITFLAEVQKIKGGFIRVRGTGFTDASKKLLTVEKIKNVPFNFGDPLSSASTLPEIGRNNNGFLGPLIFQEVKFQGNKYFMDDIPVLYPQNLGGTYFISSNNIIESFDILSYGYSAKYAQAYSGIIDITMKENVQDFGGVFDMSFLYAPLYLEGNYPTSKKEEPMVHSIVLYPMILSKSTV